MSGFPQAVATTDCCQIHVKVPNKNPEDYTNKNEYHSIILQGLVDNLYLLRDLFVGWTGKSHDARIFKNSPLYKECQKRSFLPINMLKQIGNVELSPLILVDLAYSLENWLMKPYSDSANLSPDEARFNFALSRNRVVFENVFGRFKGRFQCIAKKLDTTLQYTVNIVTTCCILQNFCIIIKQRVLHEWLQQTKVDLVQNRNYSRCVEAVNEAKSIQSAIKDYLAHR